MPSEHIFMQFRLIFVIGAAFGWQRSLLMPNSTQFYSDSGRWSLFGFKFPFILIRSCLKSYANQARMTSNEEKHTHTHSHTHEVLPHWHICWNCWCVVAVARIIFHLCSIYVVWVFSLYIYSHCSVHVTAHAHCWSFFGQFLAS